MWIYIEHKITVFIKLDQYCRNRWQSTKFNWKQHKNSVFYRLSQKPRIAENSPFANSPLSTKWRVASVRFRAQNRALIDAQLQRFYPLLSTFHEFPRLINRQILYPRSSNSSTNISNRWKRKNPNVREMTVTKPLRMGTHKFSFQNAEKTVKLWIADFVGKNEDKVLRENW